MEYRLIMDVEQINLLKEKEGASALFFCPKINIKINCKNTCIILSVCYYVYVGFLNKGDKNGL